MFNFHWPLYRQDATQWAAREGTKHTKKGIKTQIVHKLHKQFLNIWELIVIYSLKLKYISCSQHTSLDANRKKKQELIFLRTLNTRLKEHSIPACHASPTPYPRRTAPVNLVTKLNHEACILWNWICTSKFIGKIDSLQERTVLRQEISKTYLKCNLRIEKTVRMIILPYCFEFIMLVF